MLAGIALLYVPMLQDIVVDWLLSLTDWLTAAFTYTVIWAGCIAAGAFIIVSSVNYAGAIDGFKAQVDAHKAIPYSYATIVLGIMALVALMIAVTIAPWLLGKILGTAVAIFIVYALLPVLIFVAGAALTGYRDYRQAYRGMIDQSFRNAKREAELKR